MKQTISLFAASLALLATPAMAAAPMRTSAPAKPAAPVVTSATVATNPTTDRFRPTHFLGIEEARTLGSGDVVMGISGNTLGAHWGVMNGLEAGANVNLNYTRGVANTLNTPTSNSFSVPFGLFAKGVIADNGMMSLGLGANVFGAPSLTNSSAPATTNNTFNLGASVFLPISIQNMGPGSLHFMPALNLPLNPDRYGPINPTRSISKSDASVAFGYAMPVMSNWALFLVDNYRFDNVNTLSLGHRVGLTDNVTVDLGGITYTTTNTNSNFVVNLFNLSAYFGAPSADLTRAWGF